MASAEFDSAVTTDAAKRDLLEVKESKEKESEKNEESEMQGYDLSNTEWAQDMEMSQFESISFVKEFPIVKRKLQLFGSRPIENSGETVDDICKIFQKYQEQPELLDQHLQEIMDLIMIPLKKNLNERNESKINDPNWINNRAFYMIYTLSIVRGYKTIVKYMSHEVSDLEPTLDYLFAIDNQSTELWQANYVLCLWLSIIIRIPFDLKTVDSNGNMVNKIIDICKQFLHSTGKPQDGACVLLGKLFSRSDFQTQHMPDFFKWCINIIETHDHRRDIFLLTGIFHSLSEIFKQCPRNELIKNANIIFEKSDEIWKSSKSRVLRKYSTKLTQRIGLVYLKPVVASWRYTKARHQLLPDLTNEVNPYDKERYAKNEQQCQENKDESVDAMSMSDKNNNDKNDNNETPQTKNDGNGNGNVNNDEKDENWDEFEVPSEIETILDQLLTAVRDSETTVRWSAAKGVGRITMRLPKKLGDEVVTNVLELLSPTEDDEAWHGGCLCLAELARRGLLLPMRIDDVISKIEKAMLYDRFQGTYSKGSHVRDAACYVAWAFARAYDPNIMQPYVSRLAKCLLVTAVYDREIHCRRAACAAFQENVGRQGNFAHGIDINTQADFWTVGLINNSYLKVSKYIAQFEEYKIYMIDHLCNIKLSHWDLKIRKLASLSLFELIDLNVKYIIDNVLPMLINQCQSQFLFERHGALLGVSMCLKRLSQLYLQDNKLVQFSGETLKALRNILPKLEKNRGYRGRGGEYVREAMCDVIGHLVNMPQSLMKLADKAIDRYQKSINENLCIPFGFVQESALTALKNLSIHYYSKNNNEKDKQLFESRQQSMTLDWCKQLKTSKNASVTRGFARALGVLPKNYVISNLKYVIDTLISKSLLTANPDTRDYQTRKNCCLALCDIVCNEFGIGINDYSKNYTWNENETEDEMKSEMKMDDNNDDSGKKKNDNNKGNNDFDGDYDELAKLGLLDVTREDKSSMNKHMLEVKDEKFEYQFEFDLTKQDSSMVLYDRIVSAIMARFEDYEVDRRGDIGSFVREHCLDALYKIIIELDKAGINKKTREPWLRESVKVKFLNLVFRQFGEKLDRVRRAAGRIIECVFCHSDLHFPCDAALRSIFGGHEKEYDWSNAQIVFPMLVQALSLEPYRRSIFEGLLQSLGCINSTMSELTLESLKKHLNELSENAKNEEMAMIQLRELGNDLVYCVEKREFNTLFLVPFFKAIGILLTTGDYFAPLYCEKGSKENPLFVNNLYQLCRKECYKSSDIRKLLEAVRVFIGLALFDLTREVALQRLMIFLGYQYPALRKKTAQELYTAILSIGDSLKIDKDNCDIICDILMTSPWVGDLSKIRDNRNKLFGLLNIQPPKLKSLKNKK